MNYFNFLSIFEQRQQYTLSLLNCEAAAFRFINRLFMALINITYKKKKKKKNTVGICFRSLPSVGVLQPIITHYDAGCDFAIYLLLQLLITHYAVGFWFRSLPSLKPIITHYDAGV